MCSNVLVGIMTVYIVDTPHEIVSLLNDIENQPTNPPSLYLDIEGVNLSRHGSISIVQLFNVPQNHVFLIDIFVLQQAAFTTPNRSGITLRSVLESEKIPKVFFDVRNDSDALFAHFNIFLRGCHDVQLLKAANQSWVKRLAGLGQCIKQDAQLSSDVLKDWQMVKAKGRKLFSTENGGSYEVFNVRPLAQDVITYCAQDVVHLPILWSTYSGRLSKSWLKQVEAETAKRIMWSHAESYDPSGDEKVWSPWGKNVKDKSSNDSEKGNTRQNEDNGLFAMKYQRSEERMSVLQSVNMKLAHRQAEKELRISPSFPTSVGNTEQQASRPITEFMVAQVSKGVPEVKHELTLSHNVLPLRSKHEAKVKPVREIHYNELILSESILPTRSKRKAKGKPVGEVQNKVHTLSTSAMWTCTTCSREMLESQKEAHLAGKAHIARVKQAPSAASHELSLPSTGEIDSSQTAKNSTTKKGKAKAKAKSGTASEQAKSSVTGSKSIKRRARTAVMSTYPPYEPCGNADWGFVGFSQGRSFASYNQDKYWLGGGDNYGLCDKDCGWCGHCMDNVYI